MEFKLLTGDNINGFGRLLAKRFSGFGFEAKCCSNGFQSIEAALSELHPDGLVFFVTSERDELFSFIKRTVKLYPQLKIFAVSYVNSRGLGERLLELGVYQYILMPATVSYICRVVTEAVVPEEKLLYLPEIVDFLMYKGIYNYITGFFYLCTAIEMCVSDPDLLSSMTDRFYPMIAKKHDVSPALVERSLRRLGAFIADKGVTFKGYSGTYPMSNHDMIAASADEFVEKYHIFER